MKRYLFCQDRKVEKVYQQIQHFVNQIGNSTSQICVGPNKINKWQEIKVGKQLCRVSLVYKENDMSSSCSYSGNL